jgi:PAS domain S-box-containing protein
MQARMSDPEGASPPFAAAAAWEWHIAENRISGDEHFAALYSLDPAEAAAGVAPHIFFSIIHSQDRTRIRLAIGGMLRGAELFSKEFRIVLANGSMRWVHGRGLCYYNEQQEPTRFSGVLVDITEQKRVEEHLRIAETAGGIGTFEYVDGFGTASVSAQFCSLLGLHPARDLPVRTINSVVDARDSLIIDLTRHDPLLTASHVELRIRRRDSGEMRWLARRGEYLRDTESSGLRFSGVIYDITDSKTTEEQLRNLSQSLEMRVEERTRERDLVWRISPDLFAVCGFDGLYRRANPAWVEVLGYTQEELTGRHVETLVHPDDLAATREQYARLVNGVAVRNFDNRMIAKDGSCRWVSWQCIPQVDQFYAMGRDVTERKSLEDQLRQAQKMEAVGQLTGGLAHDFNNLLAGISGSLELMQMRVTQGRVTELDRYIVAAQGASRRAAALTHRLLAFSRQQALEPKPTNVNRLIHGMEEMIRRTVGPQIETEVVGIAGLWTTWVDPNQLENALLNLCINARDAMPGGGRLTIETANIWIDERGARERDLIPGQYIALSVTDTGTGMTPETVKRAFDPFYTTKPAGQGTGLGLSMIYGFVRQSGGEVRIYTELGQGTTMSIYLPRHHGEEDSADERLEQHEGSHTSQGETVLIVDDEPTVRMLVTEVIDDLGFTAIEASDAVAAIQVLQSNVRIDLLVTDVGLTGGMNGRQVADAGRAARPQLKVLFITGYAENAVIGNGHLAHGMQILTKPFAVEALATRIKNLLTPR